MKNVLILTGSLILLSCQKEVLVPKKRPDPHGVVKPQPAPKPEPEPRPEPVPSEPVPESEESVWLRNLPEIFNAENHYRLAKIYTYTYDLWPETPVWVKDDIHTFNDFGDGTIESTIESCPTKPFAVMSQIWTAYGTNEGEIKLTWVDEQYNPVTYTLISAVPGVSFKAYRWVHDVRVYYEFYIEKSF